MAHTRRRFSHDTAYGCLTHYRFRHPDTDQWVQVTSLEVAHVEQVCRYCGMPWRVQVVSCDACEESSHAGWYALSHMPDMQVYRSVA